MEDRIEIKEEIVATIESNSKPVINNNDVMGQKMKLEEDEPELMYRHCYRCPECPFRHEAKQDFIAHALIDHPRVLKQD
jgi:hypothetical protein